MERPTRVFFTVRRQKGRSHWYAHLYDPSGIKVLYARCDRAIIVRFLEETELPYRQTRSGRTFYVEGGSDTSRRLTVLLALCWCTRSRAKLARIIPLIARMGEFELAFWSAKASSMYREYGYRGVCRVSKAIRSLYNI